MNSTLMLIMMGIVIVLIVICFTMTMINSSKINTLMEFSENGDIIDALKTYYQKVSEVSKTVSKNSDAVTQSRLAACETSCTLALKKTGIVNFDAYDDVKGSLSFALAILNGNDDGIIFTSLYGHNSCNTYIREIKNGNAAVTLLAEEAQALNKAKNKFKKVVENDTEE